MVLFSGLVTRLVKVETSTELPIVSVHKEATLEDSNWEISVKQARFSHNGYLKAFHEIESKAILMLDSILMGFTFDLDNVLQRIGTEMIQNDQVGYSIRNLLLQHLPNFEGNSNPKCNI